MKINEQVIDLLDQAVSNGKPWVAFNDQQDKELLPPAIHLFSSAGEAERFCEDSNGAYDFVEQVFDFENYIYMQVATLKSSIEPEDRLANPVTIDTIAVARQMAEQSLYLPAGKSIDDLGSFAISGPGFSSSLAAPDRSLFEKATISLYFFIGLQEEKIALYNDKLEPAVVGSSQQPFYPTHLINDYLPFKNSNVMNERSFDYVKNQLFYLGFGEEVAKPLRKKMEQNLTEFQIPHSRKFGQDETKSVLHFSKGGQTDKDMTFFNRADITLKQPGKEDLTQTFFFGKEHNYTLQERYNMMDGRAAYREQPKMAPVEENGDVRMKPTGETYYAWRGLDFKNADQYGNFNPKVIFWNHQKEVSKYPIKGIEENYDKQRLIAKLEKGNKVDVILVRDGHETIAKMVANPRMARLDFYDGNGQSLIVRKREKQAVEQTQKVEMTPQEVQKASIARAAEQKHGAVQPVNQHQDAKEVVSSGQSQSNNQQQQQKDNTKKDVANEQKQDQRRRQGARI